MILLGLASCGRNEERAIREVAYNYLDAMGNYRIAEAEPYASQQTIDVTLRFFENTVMPNVDSNAIAANMPAKITLHEVTIHTDSSATVSYHKSTPIKEEEGTLEMKKEKGEWKAHVVIVVPAMINYNGNGQRREIPNRENLVRHDASELTIK